MGGGLRQREKALPSPRLRAVGAPVRARRQAATLNPTSGFGADDEGARGGPVGVKVRQARAALRRVHANAPRPHELWRGEGTQRKVEGRRLGVGARGEGCQTQ